jgi:hypothetical protein
MERRRGKEVGSPAISAGLPSSTSSTWYTLSRACAGLHTLKLRPREGEATPSAHVRLGERDTSAVSDDCFDLLPDCSAPRSCLRPVPRRAAVPARRHEDRMIASTIGPDWQSVRQDVRSLPPRRASLW